MAVIPPWLNTNPQQAGSFYGQGIQLGMQAGLQKQQIAAEMARISMAQQQANAQMQMRREEMAREQQVEQQRLEIENQYRGQMLSMAKQESQAKLKELEFKTKVASEQLAGSARLNQIMSQNPNMPFQQALAMARIPGEPGDLIQAYSRAYDQQRMAKVPELVQAQGGQGWWRIPSQGGYRYERQGVLGLNQNQQVSILQRERAALQARINTDYMGKTAWEEGDEESEHYKRYAPIMNRILNLDAAIAGVSTGQGTIEDYLTPSEIKKLDEGAGLGGNGTQITPQYTRPKNTKQVEAPGPPKPPEPYGMDETVKKIVEASMSGRRPKGFTLGSSPSFFGGVGPMF